MPIITVRFMKGIAATPEQKRELITRLTETLISILGDVVRPFTYCLIQETPVGEWGIAGVPVTDFAHLISAQAAPRSRDQQADDRWRGVDDFYHTVEEVDDTESAEPQRERHKAAVTQFYDALNQRDLETAERMLAPDFIQYLPGEAAKKGAFMDSFQDFFHAFPDWQFQPEHVVAECDRVAVRGTFTGTFSGAYRGAPATGKRVAWTGFYVHRLDSEGRIAECWQNFDAVSMQTQCGLLPLKI
jgi:steroid delta-isomerase-like uncharacterized protein/4-oxalocrotonate tautomerase family enzyme